MSVSSIASVTAFPPGPGVAWWTVSVMAIAAEILLPVVAIIIARSRLKVGWRYALFGALIFFIFQIVTRVPAVTVAETALAPALKSSPLALWAWIFVLALTAGIFEEVGRYLGYRWFMGREEKTWAKAFVYGLGHGGLESIVLVGGLGVATLFNIWLITSTSGATIPASQRALAVHQIAALAAQPAWLPLLGLYERVCAITIHVALSIVVLQVFRRGSLRWLWLAIGLHTLVDFTSAGLVQALPLRATPKNLVVEGVVTILALGAVWLIIHLRDRPAVGAPVQSAPPMPGATLASPAAE